MPQYDFGQFTNEFRQMGISDPYNQSSIAAALSASTGQEITASMVASLPPQILESSMAKTYTPVVEQRTQNLLSDLVSNLGGKEATQAAGGFAGSGALKGQQTAARDVYGAGAVDVLGEVTRMKSAGATNVRNIISSWQDIVSKVKYG